MYESAIKVEGKNIATSVVKCAETDVKGEIIVRVFNTSGQMAEGEIRCAKEIRKAELVNMNEELISQVSAKGKTLQFPLPPYKIATFKLYL